VLQNLANFYLSLLIAKSAPDRDDLVALTPNTWNLLKQEAKLWNQFDILQGQKMLKECEGQLKNTQQPRLWLEITLVGLLNTAAQPSSIVNQPTTIQPIQEKIPEQQQQQTKYTEVKPEIKEIKNEVPVDLTQNDIWQEVLNNLSPPTTQSLVSQQCNLLRLEQDCAEIAVSSEQIYKYHQNKLNTLIAAFAKVCNRPIKVNFQIISNKKKQTNPSVVKETPTAISPPQQQEKPQPQVLTPENIQPLAELPSTQKAAETIAKLFDGEILSSDS
jgi:DNA polymerase-3 subunit gamma/tau